jgi:DNA-binding protein
MSELPSAPFERIMKNVGAHRVGEDAKEKMREIVEEYSIKLATKAVKMAEHAGRKTIKAEDVKLAETE